MSLHPSAYEDILRLALAEDVGDGDVTTIATVPADRTAEAVMLAKGQGVVCGLVVAEAAFRMVDSALRVDLLARDGDMVAPGMELLRVSGPARGILTAERVALNFVQRLSGVATQTHRLVEAVAGLHTRITDTRKTTPGMRALEKYAVRCGGGVNHRMGLYDRVLIKDNHIAVAGSVAMALGAVGAHADAEIEVDTMEQLGEALAAGARYVLLDNMAPDVMARAVALTQGRATLEASGNITVDTVRLAALSGVDIISAGCITHSAPALDIGLDIAL